LQPLVTAIVTTRTRPQYVHEALASVCAETYEDVECVVVDDGGTFELAGTGWTRAIRVVRSHMRGVAGARNAGLAEARGEFVIFLDDDDVAMPSRIATLVDAAGRYRADLCFGMTQRVAVHAAGQLSAVPTNVRTFGLVGLCDVLTCAPHINSVLVRTAALRAIGGFDDEAAHFDDWSAWIRLADRGVRMCCVGDLVAEWRLHDRGLTAEVMHLRAMKARLLSLFDRLGSQLTDESARAIEVARRVVAGGEMLTYDEYADAMEDTRQLLHAGGRCLGPRLQWHGVAG